MVATVRRQHDSDDYGQVVEVVAMKLTNVSPSLMDVIAGVIGPLHPLTSEDSRLMFERLCQEATDSAGIDEDKLVLTIVETSTRDTLEGAKQFIATLKAGPIRSDLLAKIADAQNRGHLAMKSLLRSNELLKVEGCMAAAVSSATRVIARRTLEILQQLKREAGLPVHVTLPAKPA
jgi:hypothetical protein